ncbi:hypothetical protein [Pseudorhodoferax sp. Leaf267]|uniref:hypothetical protein n=1 Tax=Pseudorhodoferax sp. Leaf267 TaxID=1736316 RepID=UPI0007017B85|nr:hypothetical protein [Pseudorhodoferax sp. Leaf267]KQP18806.1 hypothetical protein ASF43_29205 [Pseudorhodoferax sp. Leaf267]
MSLYFLHQLEHAAFPLRVSDPQALRCIEELLAAQMIEGGLGTSAADQHSFAIVRRITPRGRAHLSLTRHAALADDAARQQHRPLRDD